MEVQKILACFYLWQKGNKERYGWSRNVCAKVWGSIKNREEILDRGTTVDVYRTTLTSYLRCQCSLVAWEKILAEIHDVEEIPPLDQYDYLIYFKSELEKFLRKPQLLGITLDPSSTYCGVPEELPIKVAKINMNKVSYCFISLGVTCETVELLVWFGGVSR